MKIIFFVIFIFEFEFYKLILNFKFLSIDMDSQLLVGYIKKFIIYFGLIGYVFEINIYCVGLVYIICE